MGLEVPNGLVNALVLTISERFKIRRRQRNEVSDPLSNLAGSQHTRLCIDEDAKNGKNDIGFLGHGSVSNDVEIGGGAEQIAPPPFAACQEFSVSRPSGSFATPLNGPEEDFRSMNWPVSSSRFCQSPFLCWNWVRPVTAPRLKSLPVFLAIERSSYSQAQQFSVGESCINEHAIAHRLGLRFNQRVDP